MGTFRAQKTNTRESQQFLTCFSTAGNRTWATLNCLEIEFRLETSVKNEWGRVIEKFKSCPFASSSYCLHSGWETLCSSKPAKNTSMFYVFWGEIIRKPMLREQPAAVCWLQKHHWMFEAIKITWFRDFWTYRGSVPLGACSASDPHLQGTKRGRWSWKRQPEGTFTLTCLYWKLGIMALRLLLWSEQKIEILTENWEKMRNQRVESKALSCPHQSRRAAPVLRHKVKSDMFLIPSDAAMPRQPRLICSLDVRVFQFQRVRRLAGGCIERSIHRFSTVADVFGNQGKCRDASETGSGVVRGSPR